MNSGSEEPCKKLLTYEQLAECLQVTPQSLRNWVKRKAIPYVRIGSSVRFDYDAVIAAKTVHPVKVPKP